MHIKKILSKDPNINLVKDFLPFILFFPTLIAGFHQFLQLVSMNLNLTLFFSATYVVKEGIILSSQCLVLFLISYFYRKLIIKNIYKKYIKKIKIFTFTLSVLGAVIYFSQNYIHYHYYILINIIILFICYNNIALFIKRNIIGLILNYCAQILIIYLISSLFHKSLNNDVYNVHSLTHKIIKKHKYADLIYYNDQYLFYSTDSYNQKNNILIIKMEEIFNNNFQAEVITIENINKHPLKKVK